MIVKPSHPPSETIENTLLVDGLQAAVDTISSDLNETEILLFGGPVIAVGNATRIKKDTKLVGIPAGVFILLLLIGYFRKITIPILFFLPAIFGLTFSLSVITILQGSTQLLRLRLEQSYLELPSITVFIFSIITEKQVQLNKH